MTTPLERLLAAIDGHDNEPEATAQTIVPPAIAVLHATTGQLSAGDVDVILNDSWAQARVMTYWANNPPVLEEVPQPLRHLAGEQVVFDQIDRDWRLLSETSQLALRSDAGTPTTQMYMVDDPFTGATVRLRLVSGTWRVSMRPTHTRGASVLRVRWSNGSETSHPFFARALEQVVLQVSPPSPADTPTAINNSTHRDSGGE